MSTKNDEQVKTHKELDMRFATEEEMSENKLSVFDDNYVITDEDREVVAKLDEALRMNGIDPDDDTDDYELVKTEYGYSNCKKEDIEKTKLKQLEHPFLKS